MLRVITREPLPCENMDVNPGGRALGKNVQGKCVFIVSHLGTRKGETRNYEAVVITVHVQR